MSIVIDYADPSSGNPFLKSSVGGWRSVKQGDGWIAREKESGEETPKKRQIHKKRPPLIKSLHL